jgi:hypothetical protein
MKTFLLSLIILFANSVLLWSQQDQNMEVERMIGEVIEQVTEESDGEADLSHLADQLYALIENPINLNTASFAELREIPFISDRQAYNLITYREKYENIVSLYELQLIDGFTSGFIRRISPFIKIEPSSKRSHFSFRKALLGGRKDLFMRYGRTLQHQAAYQDIVDSLVLQHPNRIFLGDANKLYLRFTSQYFQNFQYGFTLEKDKGEMLFPHSLSDTLQKLTDGKASPVFDYYSFHVYLKDIKNLKTLAIGDYHLQFGQGLVLWTSPSFGKAWDATHIKRFAGGIKAYRSTDENHFLRGIAGNFQLSNNIQIAVFYSKKKIDANVDEMDESIEEEPSVTSFQRTGLHRTLGELIDKHSIHIRLAGGHIRFRHKTLEIGVTAMETRILGQYLPRKADYLSTFPAENDFAHYGIDFSYLTGRTIIFGEAASYSFKEYATILGLTTHPHPRVSFSLLYRDYPHNYFAGLYANPFAEKSGTNNERAIYAGFELLLHKNWTMNAYIDNFSFPYLKYRTDAPSWGHDYRIQLNYSFNRHITMYFRYKAKLNQTNCNTTPEMLSGQIDVRKQSFRYHIRYSINRAWSFANRIELLDLHKGEGYYGTGYLVFQDIRWTPSHIPLSLNFRLAMFDTDSYNERIYAYEHDVLYAFSVPGHYYRGSRINLSLRYKITPHIHLWCKIGHTTYFNKNHIGSGVTEIEGNQKTDVRMQVRWKF